MSHPEYRIPNDDNVSPDDIHPGTSLVGADLSDAHLVDADLSNADLTSANLTNANLLRADLSGANLTRSNLSNTDLPKATLTDAKLHRANLSNASLQAATLCGANIRSATLKGANMDTADLSDANLRTADLSESSLQNATLSGATLFDATLTHSTLKNAVFSDVTDDETVPESTEAEPSVGSTGDRIGDTKTADLLRSTDNNRANLVEADFRRANLEGADLSYTDLRKANLNRTNCEEAKFNNAKLIRATVENADLTSTDFSQAYLYQTRLEGSQITDETQFHPAGDVGDPTTLNACRYDSAVAPSSAGASIDTHAMDEPNKDATVIRARRARSTYSRLEDLARQNGFPDLRSRMFIRRQEARRELLFAQGQLLKGGFAQLQKWLFTYGESFRRILSVSAVTVIFFWTLFMTTGTVKTADETVITAAAVATQPELVWETMYHSLSVFFAGVSPLSPTGTLGQVLIIALRATGPLLIALLIFVLGRRAAR